MERSISKCDQTKTETITFTKRLRRFGFSFWYRTSARWKNIGIWEWMEYLVVPPCRWCAWTRSSPGPCTSARDSPRRTVHWCCWLDPAPVAPWCSWQSPWFRLWTLTGERPTEFRPPRIRTDWRLLGLSASRTLPLSSGSGSRGSLGSAGDSPTAGPGAFSRWEARKQRESSPDRSRNWENLPGFRHPVIPRREKHLSSNFHSNTPLTKTNDLDVTVTIKVGPRDDEEKILKNSTPCSIHQQKNRRSLLNS